jgi:excisionase family DNA binding protein
VSSAELSTQQAAARIGVSNPTVRKLLADGLLTGRAEERGTRFRWVISEASVDAYLDNLGAGAADRRRRKRVTASQLQVEVAEIRAEVRRMAASTHPLAPSASDLGAQVVELREALLRQRAITASMRLADEARAEVVQHLLRAVAAGETADDRRREALTAAEDIIGQFVTPGHAGELEEPGQG